MELKDILSVFGICSVETIEQVHEGVWSINDKYILKKNTDFNHLSKSILLNNLLLKNGVSVPKYLKASEKRAYVQIDDTYYCLMKKLSGNHFDPYIDNSYENGVVLGKAVADLHRALREIDRDFDCDDADCMQEFESWILDEIREKDIQIQQNLIDYCYEFASLYNDLPRQLIHRDIHLGNLLFMDNEFSGYLDFDISQKNIRLFDICYLGVSMLVENYQDKNRFDMWRQIFRGIINGYEKLFKLTRNEIEAIPYMFVLIEVLFVSFFSKIEQTEISANCVDMAEWLYTNKDVLINLIQ